MVKRISIENESVYTLEARPIRYKPKLDTIFTPSILKLPHINKFWPGGIYDYKFLALIQDFKLKKIYPQILINKEKCWNKIWSKHKKFIKKYMPIITGFNPQAFGYLLKNQ